MLQCKGMSTATDLPYKISTLIYLRNTEGKLLLMQRKKHPNFNLWSSIGGKLEMGIGESPFETAVREVGEEIGVSLQTEDLHLFSIIAEKNYEDKCHWLMFLFDCRKRLTQLPPDMDEGSFAFHDPESVYALTIPETDRQILWPLWFEKRHGFTMLRADCSMDKPLSVTVEESIGF